MKAKMSNLLWFMAFLFYNTKYNFQLVIEKSIVIHANSKMSSNDKHELGAYLLHAAFKKYLNGKSVMDSHGYSDSIWCKVGQYDQFLYNITYEYGNGTLWEYKCIHCKHPYNTLKQPTKSEVFSWICFSDKMLLNLNKKGWIQKFKDPNQNIMEHLENKCEMIEVDTKNRLNKFQKLSYSCCGTIKYQNLQCVGCKCAGEYNQKCTKICHFGVSYKCNNMRVSQQIKSIWDGYIFIVFLYINKYYGEIK